uniref:Fibronectin type-III domain-containing protein n=1 Tax=Plectus sambesii TaxID=2011161 RepID=A0A914W147_9BILA
MEQLYGPFIEGRGLPTNVAEYLWNEGFTTVDSLKLLPVNDLKELVAVLPQCPNIHQAAVKLAVKRLVVELLSQQPQPAVDDDSPMKQFYGPFISRGLPAEVAEYLWNDGFSTTDSLKLLPVDDLDELVAVLAECPNIDKIAVQQEIQQIVVELNQPATPPLNQSVTPPPLIKPAPPPRPVRPPKPPIAQRSRDNEFIKIPMLDRQCQIGQLYNYNTSQLLPNKYWPDGDIEENMSCEEISNQPIISAHNLKTISDRLDVLGLKENYYARLNLLLGQASGSDTAQNLLTLDCDAKNSDCYCIRFSSRTMQKIVKRLAVDRACDGATHVVTGIVFGIDQYFVFTEKRGTSSSSLKSRIEKLVAALTDESLSPTSNIYPLSDEEPETHCYCFGDNDTRSMNMFDAYFELKRYRFGRKNVEIQPKAVIVLPLTANQFTDIPQAFALGVERFYDRFEEMKGNILSTVNEAESVIMSKNLLSSIKSSVGELNHKLNGFFTDILDKYREQKLDEADLLTELQAVEGDFRRNSVEQITLLINDYYSFIKEELLLVNEAGIAINPEDLDQHRPSLVLTINVHPLDVAVSQSILSLFGSESVEANYTQKVVPPGFHDNLRLTTDAFVNFHRTNEAKIYFACCTTNKADADLVSVHYSRSESDPTEMVSIPTPVRAETIQATSINPTSIQLQWKSWDQSKEALAGVHSGHYKLLLIGYRINIANVEENLSDFRISQQVCEEYLVTGLRENTAYEFCIQPLCRDGLAMEDSLLSRQFRTTEPERLACRMQKEAELISSDPLPIYRLKRRTILRDRKHSFCQYAIGKETSDQVGEKVLLLAGGTGSGKSTLVNAIVNFLYDVRSDDKFRLKLISDEDEFEESGTTQAGSSKTKRVSAYQLNGTKLSYRLTIVDTPGFGDTEGLDKDRETVDYMKQWFDAGALGEQKLIDAICLVMKSSETRLTAQLKHELTSVIGLFTKDMEPNILTLFTFCDGAKVAALDALKVENIPVNAHFTFNNSAFFSNLNDEEMHKIFWRRAYENYDKFFLKLDQMQPKSLTLTLIGLRLREEIELQALSLTGRIREEIEHLHNMTQIFHIVDQHRTDIARNQHFKTVQKVRQSREVSLPNGVLATTCLQCNYTCHQKCNVKDNGALYWCSIMGIVIQPTQAQLKKGGKGFDGAFKYTFMPTPAQEEAQRREACCTVCAPRCHWSKHINKNSIIIFEDVMREVNDENIMRKYEIAVNEVNKMDKLVARMTDEFIAMEQQLCNTVAEIRKLLNKLDEISLRPGLLTDAEYIKMMIEAEMTEMRDGYQHRLQVLHRHLNTVELIGRASRGDEVVEQIEHDAFDFLKTRFPQLYANIANAPQFRAQQPAKVAKPRGLYPSLTVLND